MSSGDRTIDGDGIEALRRRWSEWFLLGGQRLHVTGLIAVVLLGFITAVSVSRVTPFQSIQPLYYVFGGMISGNLTVITVVVAINQLLLSQSLYTPGEFKSEMESVIDYREDVEGMTGRVTPVEPMGFLRLLIESARHEAQTLGGLTVTETSEEIHETLDSVVSEVTAGADRVDAHLQKSSPSTFQVLLTTLTTNYARQINELRRVRSQRDELPNHVEESIENLIHRLQDIGVARQYFKTIYLQEELATLSRLLFYVGFGSMAIVVAGLLSFTASTGVSVPRPYIAPVVAVIITAGFTPISLLFAFILPIATVTQRTAATLPFTTSSQEK